MEIARGVRKGPLAAAIVLGAVAAIATLMALWANPVGAQDSTIPERDYSNTIDGQESTKAAAGEFGAMAITPTSNASSIANAIASSPSVVTGASFAAIPPSGQPHAVSDTALTGFPTNGATYGLLTTGSAALADDPNTSGSSGANLSGPNVRGDTDFDVSILKVDLSVPTGVNCLSVDFRFFSEEYPEFVGSSFNDAFIAELDDSTWTTSGSDIDAPDSFAFDENGEEISINSTGASSVSAADASGTTYDAATKLLQARSPITPGTHSLYLSIFDQGDRIYDSAVFLDSLRLFSAPSGACQEGAKAGPVLVDVNPKAGAKGVSRATNVTATFSKQMKVDTLTSKTFKLSVYNKKKKKWQPVPSAVSCNNPCETATLNPYPTNPSKLLKANKKHKVVVKGGSKGVKDTDGNPMEKTAVWKFKTGSS